ncbi:MAG: GAF domain-containing protein [Myxococcota bacterium]|nr:GAF domain-containing protein [Myxococcota bacterium]
MPELEDLHRCFHGIVPAIVATCSLDGTPNVTYLSHVYCIDAKHVALSRQFLNKTSTNIEENPFASVQVVDPLTLELFDIDLRFDHSERSGKTFDMMALRIEAIASHTGMSGVFKLIAADIYEVVAVRPLPEAVAPAPAVPQEDAPPTSLRTELRALQVVSQSMTRAGDLDAILSTLLRALEEELGFAHSVVLLLDEGGQTLYTVASLGYEDDGGIGAEVAMGEGLIGTVARERRILSLSDVDGDMRYARAIRREVRTVLGGKALRPEIPLPGLPEARSHIAIPLLLGDRLVGVLAVESHDPSAFETWHEAFLGVLAGQAAACIAHAMLREEPEGSPAAIETRPPSSAPKKAREFCFYPSDDCVFVDGEYLIRNVPGRVLWKLLRSQAAGHHAEFSNRELRLDRTLGLPAIRDNLESRLILLRKRLAQKCPDVKMVATRRGHFRLEVSCEIRLVEQDS